MVSGFVAWDGKKKFVFWMKKNFHNPPKKCIFAFIILHNYIMYSSHYQRGMNTTGFIVRLRNCRFCVFLALVVLLLAGTATPLHAQTANGYVI